MGKEDEHSDSRQYKAHVVKEVVQTQERTEHGNNPHIEHSAKKANSCSEDQHYIYQNGGRFYSGVDADESNDIHDDSVEIDGWGLGQCDTFAEGESSCRDENNNLDRDDDDVNNDNDDDGNDDNDEDGESSGDEDGNSAKGGSYSSESNETQTLSSESAKKNAECEYQKPRLGFPKAASNHGNEEIKDVEKVLSNAKERSHDFGRARAAGTTSFPGLLWTPGDEVVASSILHPNNLDSQAALSGNNATRLTQGARPKTPRWFASDRNCCYNSRELYTEDTGIHQAFLARHTTDISLSHSPRAIDWNLSGASTPWSNPSYVGSSNKSNSASLRRSPNPSLVDQRFFPSGLRQPGSRYQETRTDFRRDWQLSYQSQPEEQRLFNRRNPRNADCHQSMAQPKNAGNFPSVTRSQASSLTNGTLGPQLAPTSRNAGSQEAVLSAGIQGMSEDNALVSLDRKLAEACAVVERITKEQEEAMKARREEAQRERERMERIEREERERREIERREREASQMREREQREREERERREIERREREASQMREREQREREAREREQRAITERQERQMREREAREIREQEATERTSEEQRVIRIQGERTPIQESSSWQCQHYQRLCSVSFPCCGVFYPCHRCHNESDACEIDDMKAKQATHVKCASCGHEDEASYN